MRALGLVSVQAVMFCAMLSAAGLWADTEAPKVEAPVDVAWEVTGVQLADVLANAAVGEDTSSPRDGYTVEEVVRVMQYNEESSYTLATKAGRRLLLARVAASVPPAGKGASFMVDPRTFCLLPGGDGGAALPCIGVAPAGEPGEEYLVVTRVLVVAAKPDGHLYGKLLGYKIAPLAGARTQCFTIAFSVPEGFQLKPEARVGVVRWLPMEKAIHAGPAEAPQPPK